MKSAPDLPQDVSQKLQKVLAQAGLGSRRDMERWIQEVRVTVNGEVAGIGTRVGPEDLIKVGRRIVRWPAPQQLPRVLLYHKPEGEIVSRDDPEGRDTVFAKLPRPRGAKWLAVGRLDYNTCGLLIFTTSGEVANRMMHPSFEVEREYAVRLLGQLSAEQIAKLKSGITLADGVARCESIADGGGEGANHWYRLVLREGRNRVVRRMFEALGLTISRLMRVRFGIVGLPPRLKRGRFIELTEAETRRLLEWLQLAGGGAPTEAAVRGSTETRNRPRRWSRAK
ncbi:MAG: rRNA pseudouridine synthase [Burkholderiales bacterium]|nr:rRNA pseudouridine synthase [Burkholderiales bacterium]